MTHNNYKLPKITTDFNDLISIGEIKQVKAFAKENKCNLENYLIERLEATENELNIMYDQVFSASATYFNSYENPVLYIKAEAWERGTCKELFVHVICSDCEGCPSIIHKFEKVS